VQATYVTLGLLQVGVSISDPRFARMVDDEPDDGD
jgi:hypothetical protein